MATPWPVGAVGVCAVEPAVGRHDVPVHRHCTHSAPVGHPAGAVPSDLCAGVRETAAGAAHLDEPRAANRRPDAHADPVDRRDLTPWIADWSTAGATPVCVFRRRDGGARRTGTRPA